MRWNSQSLLKSEIFILENSKSIQTVKGNNNMNMNNMQCVHQQQMIQNVKENNIVNIYNNRTNGTVAIWRITESEQYELWTGHAQQCTTNKNQIIHINLAYG